jgi:hypothetical protein
MPLDTPDLVVVFIVSLDFVVGWSNALRPHLLFRTVDAVVYVETTVLLVIQVSTE